MWIGAEISVDDFSSGKCLKKHFHRGLGVLGVVGLFLQNKWVSSNFQLTVLFSSLFLFGTS